MPIRDTGNHGPNPAVTEMNIELPQCSGQFALLEASEDRNRELRMIEIDFLQALSFAFSSVSR